MHPWYAAVALWIFWQEYHTWIFRVHITVSAEDFSPTWTKGRWFLLHWVLFANSWNALFRIWSGSRPSPSWYQLPACLRPSQAKERYCIQWLSWQELSGTSGWDVALAVSSFWEIKVLDETWGQDFGKEKSDMEPKGWWSWWQSSRSVLQLS